MIVGAVLDVGDPELVVESIPPTLLMLDHAKAFWTLF
jgi:hypothetical protein